MNLLLDSKVAQAYKSPSQKSRVITEAWVAVEAYCPGCGGNVDQYTDNKPVADFYCLKCVEDFELKSKKRKFGAKISAGAYGKMIERINSPEKPNFFFMTYVNNFERVSNLFVVPKHFFVSRIIEKRKPLKAGTDRAGWVGSNILFSKIPKAGQIFYVENGNEVSKADVLEKWQKTLFLKKIKNTQAKGWILDIMNCIDSLEKQEFTLADVYTFEPDLQVLHPENNNVKPKIRQQLQLLRDKGYLEFVSAGVYRLR